MAVTALDDLAALRDDTARFESFYNGLRRRFHRSCRIRLPWAGEDEIDGALSDTLIEIVLERRGRFAFDDRNSTFEDALTTYVLAAARNNLMNVLTRRGQESRLFDSVERLEALGENMEPQFAYERDRPATPEQQAQERQRTSAMEDCLRKLPALARQTLSLALRGYRDEEILARLGGASAVSVRRRVFDAKSRVAECTERTLGGQG
jgi:DNA-directed RNA polymerase specialized sigma24 family protein